VTQWAHQKLTGENGLKSRKRVSSAKTEMTKAWRRTTDAIKKHEEIVTSPGEKKPAKQISKI